MQAQYLSSSLDLDGVVGSDVADRAMRLDFRNGRLDLVGAGDRRP